MSSYLLGPRLHFAGRFKADPSTVNNIPTHFDNANFKPSFQQPGNDADSGLWNPDGSAVWQLLQCTVTGGVFADGTVARTAADDPVIGFTVGDGESPPAKLVDLDSEQQMVSQIWGLQVVVSQAGAASAAFSGAFEVAAFTDIWSRSSGTNGGGGDTSAGACWQSVLTGVNGVTWGDLGGSKLLQQLQQAQQATGTGMLSIKFSLDGFTMDSTSPNFATGRIVGTIGLISQNEPHQFVRGRQCMPLNAAPVSVNFFTAVVDETRGKVIADLGNALPTATIGGPIDPTLQLELGMLQSNQQFASLGQLTIGGNNWYETTACICEFPPDRKLTSSELASLKNTPIALATSSGNGSATLVATEGLDGLHVRADDFVYRMSPNDQKTVTLYATSFGQPLPNTNVSVFFNSSGLQGGNNNLAVGTPASALTFLTSLPTDQNGAASLTLKAHNPGQPRQYIDGQVYGVGYALPQSAQGAGGYSNPSNFISVLVWSAFPAPAPPTWWGDIHPILQQYANLYPFMKQFVDLGSYDSVVAKTQLLQQVFNLSEGDSHYMPVTRDLSPAKRQTIVQWLTTTGNGGKPNLGTPPAGVEAVAAAAPVAADVDASGGGKTAAMRRRIPRPIVVARA
jgi:hypothetical protein